MKKVVIIGGGFTGSIVAKKLEIFFDVTLIDSKSFFEFTPSILKVIANPKYKKEIQIEHKKYLKNSKIIVGIVKKISKKQVSINSKKINFDYLVIATGSSYSLPIKELNVSLPSRLSSLEKSEKELKKADNIVIIGGGIVGVELAAEIATCNDKTSVKLYTSGERLMKRNNIRSSNYAEKFLEKNGVKIYFKSQIDINKKGIFFKRKKINADVFFLAIGIKNHTGFIPKEMKILNKKGQVEVDDYLLAGGYNHIFAGGDIVDIKEEKLAQNAEAHARIIAKNIILVEKRKALKRYKTKKRALLISLGEKIGILEYKKIVLIGKMPLIVKTMFEKLFFKFI